MEATVGSLVTPIEHGMTGGGSGVVDCGSNGTNM